VTRRAFLRTGAVGLAACTAAPVWLTPGVCRSATSPLLVVIFLRGGADALDLAPPIGDPDYARLRGAFAIPDPLPLADGFGLHPALAPLSPLIERGQLALVPAAGAPLASRSHFEAQDAMELGTDGAARLRDGWLARALGPATDPDLFRSVALTLRPPLTLAGSGAFAVPAPEALALRGASDASRGALAALYAAADDRVHRAGRRALQAEQHVRPLMGGVQRRGRGRPGQPLLRQVDGLLALRRAGLGVRAAFMDLDGWDTHTGQRAAGAVSRLARELATGIARLVDGANGSDVLVAVMTEFGRTVRPNGSGGTDHGHGSLMLLAGPRVRAGVHGAWPGLSRDRLYEQRDLAIRNDYRHVLHEVLQAHLGRPPVSGVFPEFRPRHLGIIA
jgi:uncharacterized protein (DUF1501 family)